MSEGPEPTSDPVPALDELLAAYNITNPGHVAAVRAAYETAREHSSGNCTRDALICGRSRWDSCSMELRWAMI
jgi:hypothetical protein